MRRFSNSFISTGLERLLIDHAREEGEPLALINHAARVLRQPGPEIPHNDHLHVRVYCSRMDMGAGAATPAEFTRVCRPMARRGRVAWPKRSDGERGQEPGTAGARLCSGLGCWEATLKRCALRSRTALWGGGARRRGRARRSRRRWTRRAR